MSGRLAWVRKISNVQNDQINEKVKGNQNQSNSVPIKKKKLFFFLTILNNGENKIVLKMF